VKDVDPGLDARALLAQLMNLSLTAEQQDGVIAQELVWVLHFASIGDDEQRGAVVVKARRR
jgi:hypothetical protein